MNDRELETRLRTRYRARARETETAPLSLRRRVAVIPRSATPRRRRLGRGRGLTLLAAALLLVGGALAAGSGLLRRPAVVPPVPVPSVVAFATASPDATSPSPSISAEPSATPIPTAGPGGAWIATGQMNRPRAEHTAVRLNDGRVLVVGGATRHRKDTSAELYDPDSGTWAAAGDMLRPYEGFPPTLLQDGKVLVGDVDDPTAEHHVNGAEVYDPASGTWTATRNMVWGGGGLASATLLRDGKVLVRSDGGSELYDPRTGSWTATRSRASQRHSHAAILLPDGKVLVAGGHAPGDKAARSAELYDPDTESWTAIASMHAPREAIEAFLQPDGTVLIVGGPYQGSQSAELFDPVTGIWTEVAGPAGYGEGTATLLSDGNLMFAARSDPRGPQRFCTAAELYDPRTGSWTTASSMLRCGDRFSFTLLLDGTVLLAGGRDCNGDVCVSTDKAERYVPAGVVPPPSSFPSPAPPAFPSPTPRPTPFPPAAGPVPPNPRSWTVTVDNNSSGPATLFVAEEDGSGMLRLVGSATPKVVPPGATLRVTFFFPANGGPDGWIYVNPRPGEGGSLVHAADIGIPGKIVITADGQAGWLSP